MFKWLQRAASGRGRGRAADSSAWNPTGWWWCLDHGRAENPPDAPGHRRLGPYDTAEQAAHWRQRLDDRNEEWDESDRRWAAGR
ncbi:hypothetical protein [Frankia sp. QA3]|uniref:hypothetical protein n=1 Tax=Frankia sp. QA3 TaxID=710111 RepID=UPI000269BE40|nr:hypothetical protein [Frankia sp. QA3]EIV91879.1 hypothetical protein FraQA3DRAFT_1360 [Frankia sp. QA3]